MESKKLIFRETGIIAVGQAVCAAAMIIVSALLGKYDTSVLLGSIAGTTVATANFLLMAQFAAIAAQKAEVQDVAGGQRLIQLSYLGRMAGIFLVLALCAKSGLFHILTLVLPLTFTRPILTIAETLKKKGNAAA